MWRLRTRAPDDTRTPAEVDDEGTGQRHELPLENGVDYRNFAAFYQIVERVKKVISTGRSYAKSALRRRILFIADLSPIRLPTR